MRNAGKVSRHQCGFLIFDTGRLNKSQLSKSQLSLEEHRHNGETADAGGEEAEEDVGGGDQPEGKDVDHGVAVQGAVGRLGIRPVDPVKGKCLVNIGAIGIFFTPSVF